MSDNKVLISSKERRKITIADDISNETIALSINYLQNLIDEDDEKDEKEKNMNVNLFIYTFRLREEQYMACGD